jgi:DNA-binding GntR family transcriptional regulator
MEISRESLRERIKKIVLERIMDGPYRSDFQLKEVSLAEGFGHLEAGFHFVPEGPAT